MLERGNTKSEGMGLSKLIRIGLIRLYSLFLNSNRSKVIFYHDIHDKKHYTDMSTSIELFVKHIKIIHESGYEIVSEITKENGQIEICFDDAFLGLYENLEILVKYNIPVHLFVISSYIGRKNYINKIQLLEMSNLDIIKISSHTHAHKVLNQLTENELEIELKRSKGILENLLDISVKSICYPKGKFNDNTIKIAKSLGYQNQYSSLPGFFSDRFKGNVIRRSLVQFAAEKELQAILNGGDHILSFWYRLKHFRK